MTSLKFKYQNPTACSVSIKIMFSGQRYSYRLLIIGMGIFLLSYSVVPASFNNLDLPIPAFTAALAQAPSIGSLPSSPTNAGLPTIQITSVQEGQQVPPGELTIQGVSSDTEDTDCQVFADVNDVSPMQNVTAADESGDEEDLSTWTFTYTEDYQTITPGQNELTAKISCPPQGGPGSFASGPSAGATEAAELSEWHTVNVTGVVGAPPAESSPTSGRADGADGTGASVGDGGEGGDGEGGDGEVGDGGLPSLFG